MPTSLAKRVPNWQAADELSLLNEFGRSLGYQITEIFSSITGNNYLTLIC